MSAALLTVSDLEVRYAGAGTPAVHALSFELEQGGSLAIVGESGSGKSTAALALTRLLPRDARVRAGEIAFEGRDLQRLGARELRALRGRRIAMVFQDPAASWNPTRRIGAQLRDGLRAAGLGDEAGGRVLELLRRVGIQSPERRLEEYPHHLSGGMLQRIMIAGALAAKPSLLIADEPTSALDATVQAELLALLAELRAETGLALLIISHDLAVVARVAERTVVLYAGKAVEQAPTGALFSGARHPYTLGLLRSTPRRTDAPKAPLAAMRAGEVAARGCPFAPRCPLAVERCVAEEPGPRLVGASTVACHRAEEVQALAARPA
jgi:oligopeptide/dipeptide ABC transporter ATP-binding protein